MVKTSVFNRLALLAGMMVIALVGVIFLAGVASPSGETVQVRVGQHAIDRHAKDALLSRLAVFNCDPVYLQVLVHNPIVGNSASRGKWLFVCPNTTATLCAGMVVGDIALADGVYPEITAFVATCGYWLSTVPTRDGYSPAEVVMVEKALLALVAMQEVE